MSIERLSSDVALANVKNNAFAKWPSRNAGDNRIEPVAKPGLKPGFRLETGAKVFTIGSCFARHVEGALMKRGFDLPAWHILERIPEFREDSGGALNNYSVASIYNELAWALDPGNPFQPEDNFFEVYPGNYLDVHLHRTIRPTSLEAVTERRNIITEIYKQIVECPLIIITLGLTECWYDKMTNLYLNVRPNRLMFNAAPDRYEMHVFDYEETIKILRKSFDLLAANCRSDRHLLLTVSPVPMGTTHRDMDVLTANTYSKAVLRAAAEEITASYDFVEYYPSFESVTLSRRELAWVDDQIHVSADLVNVNIERMIAAYVGGDEDAGASGLGDDAAATLEAIRYGRVPARQVIDFFVAHPGLIDTDAELRAAYCEACLDAGEVELAGKAFGKFPRGWNPIRLALLRARWQLASGSPGRAAQICRRCLELNLTKKDAQTFLVVQLSAVIAGKGAMQAVELIDGWKARHGAIKEAEPYRLVAVALAGEGRDAEAEAMFANMMRAGEGPSDRAVIDYATFLIERGRMQEAEGILERIDDESPDVLARLALVGMSLLDKGAAGGAA